MKNYEHKVLQKKSIPELTIGPIGCLSIAFGETLEVRHFGEFRSAEHQEQVIDTLSVGFGEVWNIPRAKKVPGRRPCRSQAPQVKRQ